MSDLADSLFAWRLWSLLGWIQIRQRYSRSKLGPFWLTISMGVLVSTMGVVYGSLFGQSMSDYLPMVADGIVIWGLFSSMVNEGCTAYIDSSNYIRQVKTPRLIYVLQSAWRNIIIFLHNFIIILLILVIFGVKDWWALLLFIPGFFLLVLNALWIACFMAVLSARFRDLPQIVSALLQVAFYVTPILFQGSMLSDKHRWIVVFNPLAYLIEIVRGPLLGNVPDAMFWIITSGMALIGWGAALFVTGRYHRRIPYWV